MRTREKILTTAITRVDTIAEPVALSQPSASPACLPAIEQRQQTAGKATGSRTVLTTQKPAVIELIALQRQQPIETFCGKRHQGILNGPSG